MMVSGNITNENFMLSKEKRWEKQLLIIKHLRDCAAPKPEVKKRDRDKHTKKSFFQIA